MLSIENCYIALDIRDYITSMKHIDKLLNSVFIANKVFAT